MSGQMVACARVHLTPGVWRRTHGAGRQSYRWTQDA